MTKDLVVPDKAILLPGIHADSSQMGELIDSNALYLFDRAYLNYKKYDEYCREDVLFITWLKKNEKVEVLSEQESDPENLIFRDAEVFLGNEYNGTKMQYTLRIIDTEDQGKNPVTIMTNCFHLTVKEIGDLYRYGKSQNAVYNQIWIALITYCLGVLLQLKVGHSGSLLELTRNLKTCQFKDFGAFTHALFLPPSRTSKGRRKLNWKAEFLIIEQQFSEGEVSHFDNLRYDPLFIDYK